MRTTRKAFIFPRTLFHRYGALCAAVLLWPLLVYAQTSAVVTGRVTDPTKAVLPGATIILRTMATGAEQTLATDADGNFRIENLAPGAYRLTVRSAGLAEKTQEFTLSAGQSLDLQIVLNPPGVTETVEVVEKVNEISTAAAKTDTPLLETPQSISVIPRERLVAQNPLTMQAALRYTAGVRAETYGFDSRGDWATMRGGSWGQYLNGLRMLFGVYNNTRPDPFALERIDVLRGPSSVLYGQGGFGGVVNLVSKRPLATPRREISVQFGNFGRKQLAFDLTGAADDEARLLYRVVALGRDSGTQVKHVPDDRLLFAPSLTWKPRLSTTLTVLANFQQDKSGSSVGFFPWQGTLLPHPLGQIPTSAFISEPGFDEYNTDQASIGYLFEHRFSERWTLRQNLNFSHSKASYQSLYSRFGPRPAFNADERTINRTIYVSKPEADSPTVDTQLETHWRTGLVRHTLLTGVDYQKATIRSRTGTGNAPAIDVFNPVYGNYTPLTLGAVVESRQDQTGLYAQDQIKFGERWAASLGIRKDWADSETAGVATSIKKDQAVTGRVGLVYLSEFGLAPYVSYAQSFLPLAGLDFYNNPYKPLRGKQVEFGVRYKPRRGNGLITLALFDLREENRRTPDPANPRNSVQLGEARIRGLELEASTRTFWQIDLLAGYSYTDAKVSKSNGSDLGKRLPTVPAQLSSLWATRSFRVGEGRSLTAGGGVRYTGASWDGGDVLKTPGYTLFDAMLAYDHRTWRVALNAANVADKVHVTTCLARGDCFYGSRRNLTATISYRF